MSFPQIQIYGTFPRTASGRRKRWGGAMDTPLFAEVADSFMQFMGDSIFVAHNVNFDSGFLSYEYGHLQRRFRFPKLRYQPEGSSPRFMRRKSCCALA